MINGELALNYENVCGHRGYSYDYAQSKGRNDSIKKLFPRYSKGRVPGLLMSEIGFEDCDFISHEVRWQFWTQELNLSDKLELHLPCREPIDHLMSQCSLRG